MNAQVILQSMEQLIRLTAGQTVPIVEAYASLGIDINSPTPPTAAQLAAVAPLLNKVMTAQPLSLAETFQVLFVL